QSTLLVYVDDATSRLMHLRFVETESTFDYFQPTREYPEAHRKPVAFSSDTHGVFRVTSSAAVQGDGMPPFGRSLPARNIDNLADVFAWREERTISNNLTLQYDKVVFLIEPNECTRELRRKRVTVVDYPDGRLAIGYRGLDLPYTTFDKLRQVSQATIVENKHLGAVLSHIRERQIERAEARSQSAPRRQGQVGHMFKVG